uniref:Uncharacterized protein n=1 Tax=Romanomermis culicivorax TaxID=13658 RepID=A0A915JV53_ROMCU
MKPKNSLTSEERDLTISGNKGYRPVSSQISHIAGIGMKNWSNVLDDYWTNIVNNSIDGVVLFSLGSITNTEGMPEKWKILGE